MLVSAVGAEAGLPLGHACFKPLSAWVEQGAFPAAARSVPSPSPSLAQPEPLSGVQLNPTVHSTEASLVERPASRLAADPRVSVPRVPTAALTRHPVPSTSSQPETGVSSSSLGALFAPRLFNSHTAGRPRRPVRLSPSRIPLARRVPLSRLSFSGPHPPLIGPNNTYNCCKKNTRRWVGSANTPIRRVGRGT